MIGMVSTRRQGLTLALCWLMVSQDVVECSRLRARHVHVHNSAHHHNLHHSSSKFKHAMSVVQHMSTQDRAHIEGLILLSKPHTVSNLKKHYLKHLKHMAVDEVVDKLGDKLPEEVAAMVKVSEKTDRHSHSDEEKQPFSEKSLAKARKILNVMVEEAQGRLDTETIRCKVFYDRNRGTFAQVMADLARLSSQIADLTRIIGETTDNIATTNQLIMDNEAKFTEELKAYTIDRAADDLDMKGRMDDLAVAQFILMFTVCKDGAFVQKSSGPGAAFFQKHQFFPAPSEGFTNVNVMGCTMAGNDAPEFHFEDPKLEAEAQRFLTPGARLKLQKYLGDAHSKAVKEEALLQTGNDFGYPSDVDADQDDDLDDLDEDDANDKKGSKAALLKSNATVQVIVGGKEGAATVNAAALHAAAQGYHREDTTTTSFAPPGGAAMIPTDAPPGAEPVKTIPGAGEGQSKKCVLGKVNCGLLHDNMSIMWGEFKDEVDKLTAIMNQKAQEWADLKTTLEDEKKNLVEAKVVLEAQKNEAMGHKMSDLSEQADKNKERIILHEEFEEYWGECQDTIYEIMYTDICGVLTVRGIIATHSKEVPPKKIGDCEVSEFQSGECQRNGHPVPCDDLCERDGTRKLPGGGVEQCGGVQTLTREIITAPNEFGMKCPKLEYTRVCNQLKCPVNCKMSGWSDFSECTAECGGGTKLRDRHVVVKPKNGGDPCDTNTETQNCHTGSCNRDCTLHPWTEWSPCSQACNGGFTRRFRHIDVPVRADGTCPEPMNPDRFTVKDCNVHPCVGDEVCIAKMDLIIAIDGSGSLRESGYDVLKNFATMLVGKMRSKSYGFEAVHVGVVQFGNGKLLKEKDEAGKEIDVISPGKLVSELSDDLDAVAASIDKTKWERGFTNMAQAFPTAAMINQNSGRAAASTTMLMITDGKPSFKFSTANVAKEFKDKGGQIIVVEVNKKLGKDDKTFMENEIASEPWEANYVRIPGIKALDRQMEYWATQVLVTSCPRAESPTSQALVVESEGYELLREGSWCGKEKKGFWEMIDHTESESECFSLASEFEEKYFAYGTEAGWNLGNCYIPSKTNKDPEKCDYDKFVEAAVKFFKILPAVDQYEEE
jgi:protein required for attachment to host cells/uncharacterized protein YegL